MVNQSPKTLVRFMADNFDLLEKLCRFTSHSHGQVIETLEDFPTRDRGLTPSDLVRGGILEVDEARGHYAVVPHIKIFIQKLYQRRHLVNSSQIANAIKELDQLRSTLEQALLVRSYTLALDLVRNTQETERILRDSVEANLEGIRAATVEYRKSPPTSSKARYKRILELWEEYVLPMRDIFDTDGPLSEAADKLVAQLDQAQERMPSGDRNDIEWARHRLRRLGRDAFHAYLEAAHEVQPLYEQAKRNAQVALNASALITAYSRQGLDRKPALEPGFWDAHFGLMDPWEDDRTRKPFGTGALAGWLAKAYYRRPGPPLEDLVPPPKAFRVPLTSRLVAHRFAQMGGHTDDLLRWLREAFPEAGLREILRNYHYLLKNTQVTRSGARRLISHPEADIHSNEVQGRADGAA